MYTTDKLHITPITFTCKKIKIFHSNICKANLFDKGLITLNVYVYIYNLKLYKKSVNIHIYMDEPNKIQI